MRILIVRGRKKTFMIALFAVQLFALYNLFSKVYTSSSDSSVDEEIVEDELADIQKNIKKKIQNARLGFDSGVLPGRDVVPIVDDGERNDTQRGQSRYHGARVAIGCAITSFGIPSVEWRNSTRFSFFTALLPTFCRTASPGYDYHIYLAFDQSDPVFNNRELIQLFHSAFLEAIHRENCARGFSTALHFVKCNHEKSPAWAQNDAMMEAYLDGATYLYRVNDDTTMLTPGWTEFFIDALLRFYPPNVGVVGPHHSGGNTDILTYDFVHRTHIDIFGFYYPRTFSGWYADAWISAVYGREKVAKLSSVQLNHDRNMGRRYPTHGELGNHLEDEVKLGNDTLIRYLKWADTPRPHPDGSKVISMSLIGSAPDVTFGALRNAHLSPIHFPGWVLRLYVPDQELADAKPNLAIPERILQNLKQTSAQLVHVGSNLADLPPEYWRHLVADDDDAVDYFIVRNAASRLSGRDAAVVVEWMKTMKPIHFIRDHFAHIYSLVLDDLWGGRPKYLKTLLPNSIQDSMVQHLYDRKDVYSQELDILEAGAKVNKVSNKWMQGGIIESILYPYIRAHALCHEGIRCFNDSTCRPFPTARVGREFLGQLFGHVGQAVRVQDTQGNNLPAQCEWPNDTRKRLDREFILMRRWLREQAKAKATAEAKAKETAELKKRNVKHRALV